MLGKKYKLSFQKEKHKKAPRSQKKRERLVAGCGQGLAPAQIAQCQLIRVPQSG